MRKVLLLSGCLLFWQQGISQNTMIFNHLYREDGLSDNTVEAILQDSRGFLWIGTANGLNRYDGYVFKVYKKESDNTGLSNSYILHLAEDHKKRIWVATADGVSLYNDDLGTFSLKNQPKIYRPSSNTVRYIYELSNKTILAATDKGVNYYHERKQTFLQLMVADIMTTGLADKKITCILQDERNNIWIGTGGSGLYVFTPEFRLLTHYKTTGGIHSISSDHITALTEDKDGNIWTGYAGNGIDCFKKGRTPVQHFEHIEGDATSLSGNTIKCILVDVLNNIWIGTENGGLSIYNWQRGNFIHCQNEVDKPGSLSQKTVSAILEDQQKNIWIGTHRGGLNIFSPAANKFQFFTQGSDNRSLSFKDVKHFFEGRDGRIYISTDGGGLNIWNRQKGTFTAHRHQSGNSRSISSDAVLCSYQDSDGQLWVGTWGGGFNQYDPQTNHFVTYKNDPLDSGSCPSDNITYITEDHNKNLWLAASQAGLIKFNKASKKFKKIVYDSRGETKLYGHSITHIEKDKDANLWIASTSGGLNFYDVKKDRFTHFFVSVKNNHIITPQIHSMFNDRDDQLWVTTSRGLYRYDFIKHRFYLVPVDIIQRQTVIKSITDDYKGNLWCGTQDGLLKINKLHGAVSRYTDADGLQGLDFSGNSCLKLQSGELLFGGYNGFNLFNPEDITTNSVPPPVYITDLWLLDKRITPSNKSNTVLAKQIYANGELNITYKQATLFSVECAALNFIATNKNQYAYKLEGANEQWVSMGAQRKITFSNVAPGSYTLHIRASNNEGVWNTQGAILKIKITPPFWQTIWFKVLILLVIAGLLYFYLMLYKKLIAQKLYEKKQQEVHEMHLNFFTYISHEFRTPLSLMLGATEKLKENNFAKTTEKYYGLLIKNINRMTNLVKEMIAFRKLESGVIKIKPERYRLSPIVRRVAEEFILVAEERDIRFTIRSAGNEEGDAWVDPVLIERIILNLLNNSFKYTSDGGEITIGVLNDLKTVQPLFSNKVSIKSNQQFKEYIYIRITDNGVGIPAASLSKIFDLFYRTSDVQIGSGIGLAFVKSFTLLHGGTIDLHSDEGKGCDMMIGLPTGQTDFIPIANEKDTVKSDRARHEEIDAVPSVAQEYGSFENASSHQLKEETILLVEDNEELRSFLRSVLEQYYRVYEAQNGEDGLKKALDIHPSIIITDILMPLMNGLELCQHIRNNEVTSHIPVIILTAKDDEDLNDSGIDSGADYYFTKPISTRRLVITLKNIFEHRTKLKAWYLKDYQQEVRDKIHSAKTREIMDAVILIIDSQIDNPDLNVEYICKGVGMSKTRLFTIIKQVTGKSISEFIRYIRLKRARHIMMNEDVTITEVMGRVGVLSASYFTKVFKKEFGCNPSQFKD